MSSPSSAEPIAPPESAPSGARDPATLVRQALLAPRPRHGALLLLLTLIVFVVTLGSTSPGDVAMLFGVLLWHEAGHLLAMRAFGFADLRMFFLPFFGATVSGRKPGASAVQHSIVSLAGPLPGILLALPLALLAPSGWYTHDGSLAQTPWQMPWSVQLALMLALINAINLVPMLPLDGGRLFETLVFSRRPLLDVTFRALTIAALAWLGINVDIIWGILAALLAIHLTHHARVAFAAARLLRERPLPSDPSALTNDQLLALHATAQAVVPGTGALQQRTMLTAAVDIFDRVARRPATLPQTLLLLLAWFLGLALAAAEFLWLLAQAR